ncbi:hypothetical protein ACFL1W_01455 [Candidatus Margulisiibacteriota bacterium]
MKRILLIITTAFLCGWFLLGGVLPVQAAPSPPIFPSGGDTDLRSDGYSLHDIKGQGAIGYSEASDYGLGLGGFYTFLVPRVIEGDWPYGTVPLNISRVGSNIQITWDPMFRDPQIYVRVGDGSGQYTDTYNSIVWVPVSDPSRSGEFDDVSDLADSELIHNNQVGDASTTHPEVYYKALQAGVTTDMRDPVSFQRCIEIAWAVGKVDLLMSKGWNSVSTALSAEAFGGADGVAGDNFGEGDTVMFWDYYQDGTQDMSEFKRFSSTTGWDNPTVNLSLGQGCMFNISSLTGTATRKVTLIGNVARTDVTREIRPGWNDIGGPLPRALVSGDFLPANVDPATNLVNGDSISEWGWGTEDFSNTIRYSDSSTPPWIGSLTFKPGVGYWYNHVSTAGPFDWTVKKKPFVPVR